ncbi:hypothetical protein PV332_10635 [Streptomyces scabiei]|uniref:hypothetical protein n=1 Tax=Streptomyces scabiei TaxID=1930 RepID=UPI0029B8BF57|nr:hypothetical protein [Streptomyces scabiei]MDX2575937.1 hypothetical protein [Streptomyces scabiei]MDX2794044.1 hypothetical protein [Streptomyces scabiei]MDX2885590.1 hypothetical protein [Streptomyces scabiei]MDX2993457.1 hypothetical protein [Streptomyces scabiei]MDX3028429.1 hypothetical protein [Streptomyces scabiei]
MKTSDIPDEYRRDDEYNEIFASLADVPSFTTVETMLEQHAAYVVANLGTCLVHDGRALEVEEEPTVIDTDNGSTLYEVWVKRGDDAG